MNVYLLIDNSFFYYLFDSIRSTKYRMASLVSGTRVMVSSTSFFMKALKFPDGKAVYQY